MKLLFPLLTIRMNRLKHKVIKIPNKNGECMYGILSLPANGLKSNILIIFCQAGLALKSGVGNQFKLMCDELAKKYVVLRFDQSGTGDSEGFVASNIPMNDFFLMVMKGRFVEDTLQVLDWTRSNFPDFKIILMGQCGGCLSAAYSGAERLQDVYGYVLLAPPVLYLPEQQKEEDAIRTFDAQQTLRGYMRKVCLFRSYINLVKGKSDLMLFFRSLESVVASKIRKIFLKQKKLTTHERFNWDFFNAFEKIVEAKRPILFIFPELDNETFDFDAEFKPFIAKHLSLGLIEIEYIPQCEHSLMFKEPRIYLDTLLDKWIRNLSIDYQA